MTELNAQQIKELVDSQLLEFAPRFDGNGNIVSIDLTRNNEFNKN